MVPYDMNTNFSYQCPITGKTFEFSRDMASKKEAFASQQLHTAGHIQRLEQAAGKELTYLELIRAGRVEREQAAVAAKAAEMKTAEETAKKPQERDPFVEAILGGRFLTLLIVASDKCYSVMFVPNSMEIL